MLKVIRDKCPYCDKVAKEKTRSFIEPINSYVIKLECGHTVIEKAVAKSVYAVTSLDGKTLYPFQQESIEFAEQSNARCLIAHEMGLGKTVIVDGLLKLHPELLPALFICKSALKRQLAAEAIRWGGVEFVPQVIENSKTVPIPGFSVYIVSYDLLRRSKNLLPFVADGNIKTIVLDECQAIKNPDSDRTSYLKQLTSKVKHIIALSGTPISKNAGEYFSILNILQPKLFPYYSQYLTEHCDTYGNGGWTKVGGLKNPDRFKELTKYFIFRKTREEVKEQISMKQTEAERRFFHVELDAKFKKAYDAAEKDFQQYFDASQGEDDFFVNAIAKMSKLRHITGLNKIEATIDFVTEFLESTNRKMVIFTHHVDVAEFLEIKLNNYLTENQWLDESSGSFKPYSKVLHYSSDLSSDARNAVVSKFRDDNSARILVASTLSTGVGLNLQFCSDCIMMERQWNPSDEEQAESRFIRIGQNNWVTATYMIASNTIDEFFTELVEQKRAIVAGTLDYKEIAWDSNSLMKDLMEVIASKGNKRWSL